MICKGHTHSSGKRLARYLMQEPGVLVYQLRGFAADNIYDALASIDLMGKATRSKRPILHAMMRLRPGESITPKKWEHCTDRAEGVLDLAGHARGIVMHSTPDGGLHIHVFWNRIDEQTMKVKKEGLSRRKLRRLARQLEWELGFSPVPDQRPQEKGPAPVRWEVEQAKRLGLDVEAFRARIGGLLDDAADGRAFAMGLADHGLILARGDRAAFVMLDRKGNVNGLARLLNMKPDELDRRLRDIDHARLAGVEDVRKALKIQKAEIAAQKRGELAKLVIVLPAAAEKAAPEAAAEEQTTPEQRKPAEVRKELAREKKALLDRKRGIRAAWKREQKAICRNNRAVIRDAWAATNSGKSFVQLLAAGGMTLARGRRNSYAVTDAQGVKHPLTKLLRFAASEIHGWLKDFTRMPASAPKGKKASTIQAEFRQQQAALCKHDRAAIRQAWRESKTAAAFTQMLAARDMILKHGPRDSYAVMDVQGVKHALPKLLHVQAAEVRKKLKKFDSS
ncbi:MAG: relaxase/mobilization nuclease domain-containing protein [Alphaproteobacteria bacterium]